MAKAKGQTPKRETLQAPNAAVRRAREQIAERKRLERLQEYEAALAIVLRCQNEFAADPELATLYGRAARPLKLERQPLGGELGLEHLAVAMACARRVSSLVDEPIVVSLDGETEHEAIERVMLEAGASGGDVAKIGKPVGTSTRALGSAPRMANKRAAKIRKQLKRERAQHVAYLRKPLDDKGSAPLRSALTRMRSQLQKRVDDIDAELAMLEA